MIISPPPPPLYLDDDPSPSPTAPVKPPRSDSQQQHLGERRPPSLPSSQSLQSSGTEAARPGDSGGDVPTPFSLIAPPPRERGAKAKARCSTLPPRPRGAEARFSLARPSHSTSLGRFQQQVPLVPLLPLAPSPASASCNPLAQLHTSPSPSPSPQREAAVAPASTELFALKGPPPQPPRSRVKSRCATLPPRQRAPGPDDPPSGPSHSSSVTQLGGRVPPSPSELRRNTPV